MMTKLTAPKGCCRQNSAILFGFFSVAADVGRTSVMASRIADARIEHRVEQVDRQIDENVECRDQHHHALDEREVIAGDALYEKLSDAVEVEHLLGDHKPADQEGEFETDHRDGGEQR